MKSPRPREWTDDEVRLLTGMARQNLTSSEIASALGRHVASVKPATYQATEAGSRDRGLTRFYPADIKAEPPFSALFLTMVAPYRFAFASTSLMSSSSPRDRASPEPWLARCSSISL